MIDMPNNDRSLSSFNNFGHYTTVEELSAAISIFSLKFCESYLP